VSAPGSGDSRLTSVLVVDDALFMRRMIRDILDNSGRFHVAAEAASGEEATRRYAEHRPDLVTMDLTMPGMDGIAALREILKMDPAARIVMCSAVGQERDVLDAIAAGAVDFILKPFTPENVIRVLDGL